MLVLPIGSADMPVVMALLNSYAGLAASATGFAIGNNVYEELYLVKRRNGGFFQISTSTPLPGRATAEAVGARYRAAIGALLP